MTNPEQKVILKPTERKIKYDGRELADLNPEASVEEVVRMHKASFPELATAVVEGPVTEEGYLVYTATKRLGTKG